MQGGYMQPTTVAEGLELIAKPEFHLYWGLMEQAERLVYEKHMEREHYLWEAAQVAWNENLPPCPIRVEDLAAVKAGSDEEWDYNRWLEECRFTKQPIDFRDHATIAEDLRRAVELPRWRDIIEDNVVLRAALSSGYFVDNGLHELTPEEAENSEEFATHIQDGISQFLGIMQSPANRELWATYQKSLADAERAAASAIAAEEVARGKKLRDEALAKSGMDLGATVTASGTVPTSALGAIMASLQKEVSRIEARERALDAAEASIGSEVMLPFSPDDMVAFSAIMQAIYETNIAQTRKIEAVFQALAIGTVRGVRIRANVATIVYTCLTSWITNPAINNKALKLWALHTPDGVARRQQICQRYKIVDRMEANTLDIL